MHKKFSDTISKNQSVFYSLHKQSMKYTEKEMVFEICKIIFL